MSIKRLITVFIKKDLEKKIILLAGPRQVGKTTLSKQLTTQYDYLNFDIEEDRKQILKKEWKRNGTLLILDEIHKMNKWKTWLKGVYDKEGLSTPIIVTGSARLDLAKKMGDSLAGRHFQYSLYPFDLKELKGTASSEQIYTRLLRCSGFPEPYLSQSEGFYTKWKRSHLDLILRHDFLELENVRDITGVETLVYLMQSRAGAPLSVNSLREDLQRDVKTIQKWLIHLENLFILFKITPYSKNIARSILKEGKYYFYDLCRVEGNEGTQLENLVALSLKKEVAFLNEALGIESSLHCLRQKGGIEIDFVIFRKNKPTILIEVKLSDDIPSKNFSVFEKYFPQAIKIQLVKNLTREKDTQNGIQIRSALDWLTDLDLSN